MEHNKVFDRYLDSHKRLPKEEKQVFASSTRFVSEKKTEETEILMEKGKMVISEYKYFDQQNGTKCKRDWSGLIFKTGS